MMNLAEYRRTATRLADYLPWAALVGSGVVLNKDGSFQRTAKFRGPDLDSAVAAELVAVAGRINNAVRRLGSGWSDLRRGAAQRGRDLSRQHVSRSRVGAGRCRAEGRFRGSGHAHFVSGYFLTFLWLPPPRKPRAPKHGSTRAARKWAWTRGNCCAASSTAPTACWRCSTASCPSAAGSMTRDADLSPFHHLDQPASRARARGADAPRRAARRPAADRRAGAAPWRRASARPDHHRLSRPRPRPACSTR
jgi:hypothetical protein